MRRVYVLPEEVWWGALALAVLTALAASVGVARGGANALALAPALACVAAAAAPALGLAVLLAKGRARLERSAGLPRFHTLSLSQDAPPARLRSHAGFAVVGAALLAAAPAVPFLYEFALPWSRPGYAASRFLWRDGDPYPAVVPLPAAQTTFPALAVAFAGALCLLAALTLYLRRLNEE